MNTDGVALAAAPDGRHLAWAGVEVRSGVDLRLLTGYAGLTERQRRARAHEADAAYLGRLCAFLPTATVDLRWLACQGRLRVAVLARCGGPSADLATAAATGARQVLGELPEHVAGGPVTDAGLLHHLLHPLDPDPAGLAEIRRVPLSAQPQRPDAHTDRYVAVLASGWHPDAWDRLVRLLVEHPGCTVLSVGLQPWATPPQLADALHREAEQYARLAGEAVLPGTGLVGTTRLAADRFAVLAAPVYAEAARRYRGPVFRVRVTLASSAPLGGALVGAARDAFATADPAGLACVPPAGPDRETALRLLYGLGVARPSTDAALLLASLADPAQAAAYCQLPAAVTGTLPGLPVADPAPDRLAGGIRVLGDYVAGDKTGGDTVVSGGKHVHPAG